jgi:hypothetical protein
VKMWIEIPIRDARLTVTGFDNFLVHTDSSAAITSSTVVVISVGSEAIEISGIAVPSLSTPIIGALAGAVLLIGGAALARRSQGSARS